MTNTVSILELCEEILQDFALDRSVSRYHLEDVLRSVKSEIDVLKSNGELIPWNETIRRIKNGERFDCNSCHQICQMRENTITSSMAHALIRAIKLFGMDFGHISKIKSTSTIGGGDFQKFKWWGMIEAKRHVPGEDGKGSSGYWRVTPRGS